MIAPPTYHKRAVDTLLGELLATLPAVMINGPRASGKTTTARRHAKTVIRLDRPLEARAFAADPDAALRGHAEPVLLDEWQVVPDVLGAIKRAVDDDARPGRYLLTGSVRARLTTPTWPGTGRVVTIPMYGLTVKEQLGRSDHIPLLDRLANGQEVTVPTDAPDLRDYVQLALASGFPEAVLATPNRLARRAWLEGYIEQVISRDVAAAGITRDPVRLRRYVEAYALSSSGLVRDVTLFSAAQVNRKTAAEYERVLADLYIADSIPAWTSNRLKRLTLAPRRYLVDAGLMCGILQVDVDDVMRDGDLLGRVLDTFVVSQLRSELPICDSRARMHHLRTREGRHEIDVIAEIRGGGVVALEVKADSAPGKGAARHIAWLRDELGDRFVAGAVLHTGTRAYRLDEKIQAVPICALWG